MSLKIRLSRGGAKKRPSYRVVVADSRMPRDGRFIERLGIFDPLKAKDSADRVVLDAEKAKAWIAKGAQPTDRVARLLDCLGVLTREQHSNPKKALPKKKAQERAAAADKAAARSCAFFLGNAFLGLLCCSRVKTPRPSSRRATRSVGCAPLAIQAFALS